jgi:hypothetical protein
LLCALSDGGEALSRWVVGLVLIGGLCGAFAWDGDVGWFFSVVSSGLSLGLERGGHQMLGSNSRGLLDPEHGKNANVGRQNVGSEGVKNSVSDNKCTKIPPPWGNPRGSIYRSG